MRHKLLMLTIAFLSVVTAASYSEAQSSAEVHLFLQKHCTSGDQVPTPPGLKGWCFKWDCFGVTVITCHQGFNSPYVVIVEGEVIVLDEFITDDR